MTRKVGTSVTSRGSISVDRMTRSRIRSPGKRYFASPYPASVQKIRFPNITDADTMALLKKKRGKAERESALG